MDRKGLMIERLSKRELGIFCLALESLYINDELIKDLGSEWDLTGDGVRNQIAKAYRKAGVFKDGNCRRIQIVAEEKTNG